VVDLGVGFKAQRLGWTIEKWEKRTEIRNHWERGGGGLSRTGRKRDYSEINK
jgi:hypothetical protein